MTALRVRAACKLCIYNSIHSLAAGRGRVISIKSRRTMNTTSTDFITAVRAVRAVSGSLSIIGASLIIGTFITFKSTRTVPRFMLVNLAVADLIIGISFFPDISEDTLCTIQAGLRVFGLNSAIFWITAIPLYMFVAFVLLKPYNKKVATLIFVFCWAAPFIITLWLALCHHLGRNFDITRSCFIMTLNSTSKDPDGDGDDDDDDNNCEKMVLSWSHHYPLIMGYLVWNSMSFVILPLLYVAIRCRIWRLKVKSQIFYFMQRILHVIILSRFQLSC